MCHVWQNRTRLTKMLAFVKLQRTGLKEAIPVRKTVSFQDKAPIPTQKAAEKLKDPKLDIEVPWPYESSTQYQDKQHRQNEQHKQQNLSQSLQKPEEMPEATKIELVKKHINNEKDGVETQRKIEIKEGN